MRARATLAILAAALIACRGAPDPGRGLPALPVDLVWDNYQSHAGKKVVVEGFLMSQGSRYFLIKGASASASDVVRDENDTISYYCTYQGQPEPLPILGLSRRDLRAIVARVKHRPAEYKIEGQRVRITGTVEPVQPGTEGTQEIILPFAAVVSGGLERASIVTVTRDFCRGHRPQS